MAGATWRSNGISDGWRGEGDKIATTFIMSRVWCDKFKQEMGCLWHQHRLIKKTNSTSNGVSYKLWFRFRRDCKDILMLTVASLAGGLAGTTEKGAETSKSAEWILRGFFPSVPTENFEMMLLQVMGGPAKKNISTMCLGWSRMDCHSPIRSNEILHIHNQRQGYIQAADFAKGSSYVYLASNKIINVHKNLGKSHSEHAWYVSTIWQPRSYIKDRQITYWSFWIVRCRYERNRNWDARVGFNVSYF